MKVLVVGFPKTGTKSMTAALKMLGYKVYDYEHNFYYLRKEWVKILTTGATKEDFYHMYKDVDAVVDMPALLFWEEIMEAFPDVKLVLMTRNSEDVWFKSWERQAKAARENHLMTALAFFSPTCNSMMRYSHHIGRVTLCAPPQPFYRCFQGVSPTVAKKRYRDHNTRVQVQAPKQQLLQFKLSEGWGPLCEFLGRSIPDMKFPHKNKDASLLDDYLRESPVFIRMQQEMKIAMGFFAVFVGVVLYFLFT